MSGLHAVMGMKMSGIHHLFENYFDFFLPEMIRDKC